MTFDWRQFGTRHVTQSYTISNVTNGVEGLFRSVVADYDLTAMYDYPTYQLTASNLNGSLGPQIERELSAAEKRQLEASLFPLELRANRNGSFGGWSYRTKFEDKLLTQLGDSEGSRRLVKTSGELRSILVTRIWNLMIEKWNSNYVSTSGNTTARSAFLMRSGVSPYLEFDETYSVGKPTNGIVKVLYKATNNEKSTRAFHQLADSDSVPRYTFLVELMTDPLTLIPESFSLRQITELTDGKNQNVVLDERVELNFE